jgi:hypothetical protein
MTAARRSFTEFVHATEFDRGPRCSDAYAVTHASSRSTITAAGRRPGPLRGARRSLAVLSLCSLAMLTSLVVLPDSARAGDPEPEVVRPPPMPMFELESPSLAALPPSAATLFAPTILAKRARDRAFDTSMGERDPRARSRPRTHRFRLALTAHWVRLTQTQNPDTGEFVRFHYAPMYLDLAYQAQFLKYMMVRLAVGIGGNVANSRNAMPVSVFPQTYLGYQGKIAGVAFGYGFDWTIPPTFHARSNPNDPLEQPVITRNHVVMGELSATSRIDRVALTFSLSVGGIQSDLTHFDTYNRKWRPYFGFGFGAFFDGSRRREKKALKKADAEGR